MSESTNASEVAQAASNDASMAQAANPNSQAEDGREQNSQPQTNYQSEYEKLNGKHSKLLTEVKNLRESLDGFKQTQKTDLEQQGQFKPLYEQTEAQKREFETRVRELEPQLEQANTRLERFNKLTLDRAKAEIKDWPEKVAALLPKGDSVDALDYLEAVEKYRPLVDELRANSAPGARPNQPRPAGQGQPGTPLVSATRRF
jgi:chromosome segregation ATPase